MKKSVLISSLYGLGKDLADESAVQEGISPQANESDAARRGPIFPRSEVYETQFYSDSGTRI
jgi:hypothetical protein